MSQLIEFLSTAVVVDTETTGLDPTTAEIIEFATGTYISSKWHVQSQLFDAEAGVPPESSAKNQISSRMVKGKLFFDQTSLPEILNMMGSPKCFVAHNAEYDRQVLQSSFTRMGEPELAELFGNKDLWICTWRLARRIYQHSFADKIYGQNYLRYRLDLPVDDSVGVHRAGDDVLVCGVLLERLINDAIAQNFVDPTLSITAQLLTLTHAPIPVENWPMGKYKGTPLVDVPTDYYLWIMENQGVLRENSPGYDFDLAESVRAVLESRLSS
jgi:DNA polymerase III epsilon subunit-like protein